MTAKPVPLWLLASIAFSGTLAMHIFVPALPYAASDLGASVAEIQLTVTLYIVGLALGQLVYGPLSDRFGRRPTLMAGLALYTVSGLAAALAPQAQALIAARLLQALGGCAGLVLGRAMVRDTGTLESAGRRLALLSLVSSVGLGLAPLAGGVLASTLGWRAIFFALCALGVANMLFSWRLLPETGARTPDTNFATLARDYRQLLRSPVFLGYAFGGGFATTSVYAFIAAAPFIFVHQLQRPAHEVGIYLAILISGMSLGSVISGRLIGRVPLKRLLLGANAASVLAGFALLAVALSGRLSVPLTVATMFVFFVGSGTAGPAALTQAISVNTRVTGSASGLYGFAQMAIGAICSALVGLGDNPALAAATVLAVCGVLGQCCLRAALHREARQRE